MNSQYKWPLVCVGALAGGWLIGYVMGGKSDPNAAGANGGKSPPTLVPSGGRDPQVAKGTADDEKQAGQHLLSVMRDPNYRRREHDLYDTLLKMSPGEITSAIALAERLPRKERNELLWILLPRWAENDPREAMKYALSRKDSTDDDKIGVVMNAWAAADLKAAREWAEALPPGAERTQALQTVMYNLSRENPAAALQLLRTFPAGYSTNSHYQNIFAAWAAKSPAVAANQAMALPAGQNRDEAIRGTVNGWTESDPKAALAWVAQIADPRTRRESLNSAYGRWVNSDPKAAIAAVLALPPSEDRALALRAVTNNLSDADPKTTVTLIEQMPAGGDRDQTVSNLAQSWAQKDRDAALAWVAQLPDGESKTSAQRSIVFQWAQADPRAAVDYVMKNVPLSAEDSSYTINQLAEYWARSDSQSALAWVRQLGDEKVRSSALGNVITAMGERDPLQAAGLLAELPAASQPNVASNLVRNWARNDTDGAAGWVMQLPEGAAKNSATSAIVSQMADHDLVKAAGWLETLPAGASRDSAVRDFTYRIAKKDPEGAVAWAASISETKMRNTEIERYAGKWLLRDKAAATQWITQSTALDDATKRRLLRSN